MRHNVKPKPAPYVPGDKIRALHSCAGGTCLADLTVKRVVPMNDRITWRLEVVRCDGTGMHGYVGIDGRDRHGYIEPTPQAPVTASSADQNNQPKERTA